MAAYWTNIPKHTEIAPLHLAIRCKWETRQPKRNKPRHREIIRMNATDENSEKGNGEALRENCIFHDVIPMNAWRRNHGQVQHVTHTEAKWIGPDGKTRRQIDYIAIIQKYRNFARETYNLENWRCNMEKKRQHDAIRMDICLHLKRLLLYQCAWNRHRY